MPSSEHCIPLHKLKLIAMPPVQLLLLPPAVFGYSGTWVVMVRHGAYISVYCNLKSVAVHRGQRVSARQGLGSVGADNILQFQLRKETAKLNPEAWLGR